MKKKIIGVVLFVVLIGIIILLNYLKENNIINTSNLKVVTIATGGGKENLLADERVNEIIRKKYGLEPIYDSWSNGKLIVNPLVREDGSQYDLMFSSDQRFYDYYRLPPDKSKGEADRYNVIAGGLTLNTPIVIYSWDKVVDALIADEIVTEREGVYYITDMNKLLGYIMEGKKWTDLGLDIKGRTVNIDSTDPVTSSPGATYYGLLLSVMCEGTVTESKMRDNLPRLKEFYEKSGYMINSPADLFDRYLKTGMGGYPMIVDYEKSIVDFANSNKDGFEQVKDKIRILYPEPTIWNSHCISAFTEAGAEYNKVWEDEEISQIAWDKYGFRTGVTGGNFDVSGLGINGIPKTIESTVTSLRMNMYNELIDFLKEEE